MLSVCSGHILTLAIGPIVDRLCSRRRNQLMTHSDRVHAFAVDADGSRSCRTRSLRLRETPKIACG